MKNIKLLSLSIRNFKGCKELDISFNDGSTVISGPNASGKTTVNDAFTYLCFGKDSEGNSKFGIRPVDADGNDIDNIETSVEGKLSVDGTETVFKKIFRQVWTRHRGSSAPTFDKNETIYFVDDVPRKKKEYEEAVADIVSEDRFRLISDLGYFVGLKDNDKKEILLRLIGDISDEEVIKSDPKRWAPIAEEVLNLGDADAKTKAKGEITKLNSRQKEIPTRIDEIQRQLSEEEDTKEQEQLIRVLKDSIQEENANLDAIQKSCDPEAVAIQKKKLVQRMDDMVADANRDIRRKKNAMSDDLLQLGIEIRGNEAEIRSIASQAKAISSTMEACRSRIESLKKTVNTVSERQFDESQTICKACGQTLPADRIDELKASFYEAQKLELSRLKKEGESIAAEYKLKKKELDDLRARMDKTKASLDGIKVRQDAVKADMDALPKEVSDLSGNAEYEALRAEIAHIDNALAEMGEKDEKAAEIRRKISDRKEKIRILEKEIADIQAKNNQNFALMERLCELEDEQRQNGQLIAVAEQKIILLEEFSMTKAKLLSEKVTSNFEIVNFALFNEYIRGGISEICEVTVNGVRYKDLNTGARIAASLDIVRTFQKKLEISAPIFVDGAEGINQWNIPQMPCQLVLLRVDDGKGLTIS